MIPNALIPFLLHRNYQSHHEKTFMGNVMNAMTKDGLKAAGDLWFPCVARIGSACKLFQGKNSITLV